MNNHRRALNALAVVLFAMLSLAVVAARAETGDASAIARFLAIGFANVDTKFSSIRGSREFDRWDKEQKYSALKWPDRTHFQSCDIIHHDWGSIGPGFHNYDSYECESTTRDVSVQALFNMTATALRAALPSGYTSGPTHGGGIFSINQVWTQPRKHPVRLDILFSSGKSYYIISTGNWIEKAALRKVGNPVTATPFLRPPLASRLLTTRSSAAQCDGMCTFWRDVLKEAYTDFTALRGPQRRTDITTSWPGTRLAPGAYECTSFGRLKDVAGLHKPFYFCRLLHTNDRTAALTKYKTLSAELRTILNTGWAIKESVVKHDVDTYEVQLTWATEKVANGREVGVAFREEAPAFGGGYTVETSVAAGK